jgi:hypothetical protein
MHGEFAGAGGSATLTSGTGSFAAAPPVRLALGVGAEWKRLTLEIDEAYVAPQSDAIRTGLHVDQTTLAGTVATPSAFDATYTVRGRAAWNTSAGGEYFLTPSFSLIGGVSTNVSSIPALAPTMTLGNLAQQRMHRVTASFGVGSYGEAGDLLIGAQLGYGWGQTLAVNPYTLPNDWAVVDAQSYSAMIVLAGATSFRAIKRAVERVQHVVTTGKPEEGAPPK